MRTDVSTEQRAHPVVTLLCDVLVALVVTALGFWTTRHDVDVPTAAVVVGAALAAGAARRWTALALAGSWLVAIAQVYSDGPVVATTLGVAIVAFRCARYGSRVTTWLAGLSIPAGAVVALVLAAQRPYSVRELARLVDGGIGYGAGVLGGFLLIAAVLGAPFAAGLVLRVNEHYRSSRLARDLARSQAAAEHEIARTQAAQTMLTRDVHDLVGHSLAVIIAQADSARASVDPENESVRTALAQIAAVGRSSLAEIRDVLTRTRESPPDPRVGERDELGELVAGVRAAGNPVHETVRGEPQPLREETATAAYRVLQELLTNALRHGTADATIDVARTWTADGFTLCVDNAVLDPQPADEGMGLAGVRARLAAVDGTLRTSITGANRFVAAAFLPTPR